MQFPAFDTDKFRRNLYSLWPLPHCTLDTEAAATGLGVSASTVRRWLSGKHPVPLPVWQLIWLLASGQIPAAHGWRDWQFIRRWDQHERAYCHRLVAPNGVEYSDGEIHSWHFKTQQLNALKLTLERRRCQTIRPCVILAPASCLRIYQR